MKTNLFLFFTCLSVALADRSVTIAWDAQPEATSFNVKNGPDAIIARPTTNECTIVIPDAATTIYAPAVNSAGESENSLPLVIPKAPASPKGLKITKIVRTTITTP